MTGVQEHLIAGDIIPSPAIGGYGEKEHTFVRLDIMALFGQKLLDRG